MNLIDLARNYAPFFMKEFFRENSHIVQGISNFLECEEEDATNGLKGKITPRIEMVFSTFHLVSMDPYDLFPNSLKVVFMFQDTYPTPGCACGVATATLNGRVQPTLSNMFKRLHETYKPTVIAGDGSIVDKPIPPLQNGDIRGWCSQGVLMYNAALSTREKETEAHMEEWSIFTSQLLKWISETFPFVVFVFFGKKAQGFSKFINPSKHVILTTSHPSGLGFHHGFNNCDIYNEVNMALTEHKRNPIRWEDYKYT